MYVHDRVAFAFGSNDFACSNSRPLVRQLAGQKPSTSPAVRLVDRARQNLQPMSPRIVRA